MSLISNPEREGRLNVNFDRIGRVLGNKCRREAFEQCAVGLFSDIEPKSVDPVAALVRPEPSLCRAVTEKL